MVEDQEKRTIKPNNTIKLYFLILISIMLMIRDIHSQSSGLNKPNIDDYNNYTKVGQLGLTITNFGLLGEGWNNPDQPSCRYKQYADIEREEVEHFSYAGLWIGGMVGNSRRVSTAIVDGVFDYGQEGFEFSTSANPADTIKIKSSIQTSRYFSPDAVSHEDFICDYTDINNVVNHTPLGIRVHQESYAWNYPFADAFVIIDYTVYNESYLLPNGPYTIKNLYAGIWVDASVANMNYTSRYEPGGGFTWYDNLDGFDRSLFDPFPDDEVPGFPRNIAYQYDADGDNGYAQSYVGIRFLGNESVPRGYWDCAYRQWVWSTTSNMDYPEYVVPVNDEQRYTFMQESVPNRIGTAGYNSEGWPDSEDSWLFLLSAGPLGSRPLTDTTGTVINVDSTNWVLPPGDSVRFAFAVVCARWGNNSLTDSPDRRKLLYANSDWAQIAFNGEDINGNGLLEPEEDIDGDNRLDRYILPAPPPSPKLHVVAESDRATLYWDRSPEFAKDPLTQIKDFEGYRIYSHRKTSSGESGWTLLAQFDKKNELGYNTGLDLIRITRDDAAIYNTDSAVVSYNYIVEEGDTLYFKLIEGDSVFYKFVNQGIQAGWPQRNVYAVTSYDRGDPETGLQSLESNKITNQTYVIAGKTPRSSGNREPVGVYPNPYRARAIWDGYNERDRMIWFYNLPEKARIKIFTLSGELVDEFTHDAQTYNGSDVSILSGLGGGSAVKFSGGEHAWDLITKWDQAIATGLYLFTVENLEDGSVQRGKFLVIK